MTTAQFIPRRILTAAGIPATLAAFREYAATLRAPSQGIHAEVESDYARVIGIRLITNDRNKH